MIRIWKSVGGSNVNIESVDVDGVRGEINHAVSLNSGRITGFALAVFGFSGKSPAYARAMARVLDAAASEMDRLAAEFEGTKSSDFAEVAFNKQA